MAQQQNGDTRKKVSELKGKLIGTIQSKQQREKDKEKLMETQKPKGKYQKI